VAGGYAPAAGGPLLEGSGELGGYDPQDLQSAYKIPTGVSSTQTIALVDAYGYQSAESDLAKYRERYGLEACTNANGCFSKVNEKGEEANFPANEPKWAEESALDLDMASAACPECHILLVEAATPSALDFAESVNTAANLGATEISNSYGGPEPALPKEAFESIDKYYNHPGVVVTASSGDSGWDNHLPPLSAAAPSYPAVSPYVISVGGTSLRKAANSRGWSEEVWSGSGSGCSKVEEKPAWQADAACAQRMDNDVAAVANPSTPVSVYWDGKWGLFGGTSASSPLVAGIEAHASEYIRSLGAEALYLAPTALFDVTIGSNGTCTPPAEDEYFCQAEVGYDGPTGLGTPDGVPPTPSSPPPTALTRAASGVTQTTATLNATVNPNGSEVGACRFEYGITAGYGSVASCASSPGAGTSPVAVSGSLIGLTASTIYHFRILAAGAGGTSRGGDETFTTAPAPVLPPGGGGPIGGGGPTRGGGSTGAASGGIGVLGVTSVSVSAAQVSALLARQLTPSGKEAKIAALLKKGGFSEAFKALEAGSAVIDWYYLAPGAKLAKTTKPKAILVAVGTANFTAAGTVTIKVKLTPSGRRLLAHAKRFKLTAKGTFTPAGGSAITSVKTFTLKR
jgi:hypothetical protein